MLKHQLAAVVEGRVAGQHRHRGLGVQALDELRGGDVLDGGAAAIADGFGRDPEQRPLALWDYGSRIRDLIGELERQYPAFTRRVAGILGPRTRRVIV